MHLGVNGGQLKIFLLRCRARARSSCRSSASLPLLTVILSLGLPLRALNLAMGLLDLRSAGSSWRRALPSTRSPCPRFSPREHSGLVHGLGNSPLPRSLLKKRPGSFSERGHFSGNSPLRRMIGRTLLKKRLRSFSERGHFRQAATPPRSFLKKRLGSLSERGRFRADRRARPCLRDVAAFSPQQPLSHECSSTHLGFAREMRVRAAAVSAGAAAPCLFALRFFYSSTHLPVVCIVNQGS